VIRSPIVSCPLLFQKFSGSQNCTPSLVTIGLESRKRKVRAVHCRRSDPLFELGKSQPSIWRSNRNRLCVPMRTRACRGVSGFRRPWRSHARSCAGWAPTSAPASRQRRQDIKSIVQIWFKNLERKELVPLSKSDHKCCSSIWALFAISCRTPLVCTQRLSPSRSIPPTYSRKLTDRPCLTGACLTPPTSRPLPWGTPSLAPSTTAASPPPVPPPAAGNHRSS
jgi:hypothetical protein